jgi:hypothetical protein
MTYTGVSPLPHAGVPICLCSAVKTRLLSMTGSQSIFGAAVSAPVLFYLSAFVNTILDLENSPISHDAAMSLAFGIEWMIVVHVAIVAGCLLTNNNPSTSPADSNNAHVHPGDPRDCPQ